MLILTVATITIALLVWRLVRQPEGRVCLWCGRTEPRMLRHRGGYVCRGCAHHLTRRPGDQQ